jgi:hypothetical protein
MIDLFFLKGKGLPLQLSFPLVGTCFLIILKKKRTKKKERSRNLGFQAGNWSF